MNFAGTISLVTVLVFHAVGSPGAYTISPQTFKAELSTLQAHHVDVLNLKQFEQYVDGTLQVTKPSVLITFDDGDMSDYTKATPILQSFGDPAVAFLIGKRVAGGDAATLTAADIAAMAQTGLWSFGSHTYNLHSPYTGPDEMNNMRYYVVNKLGIKPILSQDMASQNAFFATLGLPKPTAFAFPFDFYTADILTQLHTQFPYLFTSHTGFAQPGEYLIPRINVGSDYANLARLDEVIRLMEDPNSLTAATPFETRSEFIVQLDQSLGIHEVSPATPAFSDVPITNPDYKYIEGAYLSGIISGITPTEFGPNDPITRAEAAKVLVEAYEGGNYTPTQSSTTFSDNASIPSSLVGFVAAATQLKLMVGLPDGRFDPQAYLSAAQETHLVAQVGGALMSDGQPRSQKKGP